MRTKRITLTLLLFLVLAIPTLDNVQNGITARADDFSTASSDIYVTDNDGLAALAESGSGVNGDPYIISGLNIVTELDAGIRIENTNAYFRIQLSNISGIDTTVGYGIFLHNVSNAFFFGLRITEKAMGIEATDCSNLTIATSAFGKIPQGENETTIDNWFNPNTEIGVHLQNVSDALVYNNWFLDNSIGLHVQDCPNARILQNNFRRCGLTFEGSESIDHSYTVNNNNVNGKPLVFGYHLTNLYVNISGFGQVIIGSCYNITVFGGDLKYTTVGIEIIHSLKVRVAFTNTTKNRLFGINVFRSVDTIIYRCISTLNAGHGLHVWRSAWIRVLQSIFRWNNLYGIWLDIESGNAEVSENLLENNTVDARDDVTFYSEPETGDTHVNGYDSINKTIVLNVTDSTIMRGMVANVTLMVNGSVVYEGTTNANGSLVIEPVEPQMYNVTVSATGFDNQSVLVNMSFYDSISIDMWMHRTPLVPPEEQSAPATFALASTPVSYNYWDNGVQGNYWTEQVEGERPIDGNNGGSVDRFPSSGAEWTGFDYTVPSDFVPANTTVTQPEDPEPEPDPTTTTTTSTTTTTTPSIPTTIITPTFPVDDYDFFTTWGIISLVGVGIVMVAVVILSARAKRNQ